MFPRSLSLAPLGVIAALLVCLPLLCGSRAAWAADWAVSYSPEQFNDTPVQICAVNDQAFVTRSVTVTATLTWTGSGSAPKRVKVLEKAAVSWGALLNRAQDNEIRGQPPTEPNGTMSGDGSTSLTDTVTLTPDPQTRSHAGKSYAGKREAIYTVPADGVLVLTPVTLMAEATAATGDFTTGSAFVSVGTYSVSVPDGWAKAQAGCVWGTRSNYSLSGVPVGYSESSDGSFVLDLNSPFLSVSVGAGVTIDKTITATQYFTYQGTGDTPSSLNVFFALSASGSISQSSFSCDSYVRVDVPPTGTPTVFTATYGSAPINGQLSYNGNPQSGDVTLRFENNGQPGHAPQQYGYPVGLHAKAKTE